MTTTNSNGIIFLEETDDISPFHTLINVLQTGTSNALDAAARVYPVADVAARAALVAIYAPSTTKPLIVRRANASSGREFETTIDGTNWTVINHGVWTTYTATLTGFTVGTGVGSAVTQWRYEGDLIRVRYTFVIGTLASIIGMRFSLPVTSATLPHNFYISGIGSFWNNGSVRPAYTTMYSTTVAQVNYQNITTGALDDPNLGSNKPTTWTTGDIVAGELTYRPV